MDRAINPHCDNNWHEEPNSGPCPTCSQTVTPTKSRTRSGLHVWLDLVKAHADSKSKKEDDNE